MEEEEDWGITPVTPVTPATAGAAAAGAHVDADGWPLGAGTRTAAAAAAAPSPAGDGGGVYHTSRIPLARVYVVTVGGVEYAACTPEAAAAAAAAARRGLPGGYEPAPAASRSDHRRELLRPAEREAAVVAAHATAAGRVPALAAARAAFVSAMYMAAPALGLWVVANRRQTTFWGRCG